MDSHMFTGLKNIYITLFAMQTFYNVLKRYHLEPGHFNFRDKATCDRYRGLDRKWYVHAALYQFGYYDRFSRTVHCSHKRSAC